MQNLRARRRIARTRGVSDVTVRKFRLSLLSRFELTGPDGPVDLPSKKLAALLAYLVCTAPAPQAREKLATLLWGSHFEAQARQNLRQALFQLRRVLGPDAVRSEGENVRLAPDVIDCDAARMEALIGEGSRGSLGRAVELYKDRFLAEMAIGEEAWTEWVDGERQRLKERVLDALVRLAGIELALGHGDKVIETAQRALAINNLREDAHRLILQALAAAGRKAEALKHYQALAALLKRELNAEPDAATASLAAELRSAAAVSALPRASEAAAPRVARSGESSVPAVLRASGPERRQLTILLCNLIGAAPESAGLDPEDLHEQIAAFHQAAAEAVAPFSGYVAQRLSDGVVVYFGYPTAHEHDAEHAVRAGLAIHDMLGALKLASGTTPRARIGIATGLVVVSEQLGPDGTRQHIAVGDTPTLAARLQSAASRGEIVISASTRRLIGRIFDCREIPGAANIPVEGWQVHGETVGISRFEARHEGALSPLVGRQEEIDILLRRWQQATLGEGRVALLSGEPGIGKSRIAESLLAKLEGEPHVRLRYYCSPHHAHSPFYPFIAQLEHAAGFETPSDAQAKLDKLEALLRPTAKNVPLTVVLCAELLGIPMEGRYPALAASPQQKREMILRALLEQLEGMAAKSPVLIVFEDAHWIDPTSLDLLDRIVAGAAELPVLVIITSRPEFDTSWVGQPHVTALSLSRLDRRECVSIIGSITRDKAFPAPVLEQILSHTDGVPLFIEELTSTLLESGLMRETADGYVLDRPLPPLAVPMTLQASLVARLDRLGPAKDVALVGAVIGREFSHELIAAVSPVEPEDLDTALGRLVEAGLIARRGSPPDATYSFKHALVQDAAYATLLKSRRRQLHASIAELLVDRFPAAAERLPEVVAHHFTEAGLASEAIGHWVKAGRLARARWANREAVECFEQTLNVIKSLPVSPATQEQAFDILLELRPALIQLGEPRQALERLQEAESLAERLNDDRRRGWVCALMTNAHSLLGELDEALPTGARALEIAGRLKDLRLRVPATSYLEQAHYYRGEYEPVVALATDNIAALPADWVSENFGMTAPPSVWDRCYLMLSLTQLGRFAEAAHPEADAIRFATATHQAFTISLAHFVAGWVRLIRGDWAQARPPGEQSIEVMRAGNVAVLLPTSVAYSAWGPGPARRGEPGAAAPARRRGALHAPGVGQALHRIRCAAWSGEWRACAWPARRSQAIRRSRRRNLRTPPGMASTCAVSARRCRDPS